MVDVNPEDFLPAVVLDGNQFIPQTIDHRPDQLAQAFLPTHDTPSLEMTDKKRAQGPILTETLPDPTAETS
jgi:hypothetical protein